MKISKWYKLVNKIIKLKSRKIPFEIYVKDDPENTATYRDLEIGYSTETWQEYNDLLGFYHRYIHIGEPVKCDTIAGQPTADLKEFMHSIREELKGTAKNSWTWFAENVMQISTGRNNYSVSINDAYLRIAACLKIDSGAKQNSIQLSYLIAKKVRDLTAMKVEVYPDPMPGIVQKSGQTQHTLKSTCIAGILEAEAPYMIQYLGRFIDATDDLVVQLSSACFRSAMISPGSSMPTDIR